MNTKKLRALIAKYEEESEHLSKLLATCDEQEKEALEDWRRREWREKSNYYALELSKNTRFLMELESLKNPTP